MRGFGLFGGVVMYLLSPAVCSQPTAPPPVSAALTGAMDGAVVFRMVSESIAVIRTDAGIQGSAVAIASLPEKGTAFATNCHVLVGATKFSVSTRRNEAPGMFFGGDPTHDTCVVFAEFTARVPDMFNVLGLLPGEKVFAIGAPRGLELSITEGIFSARRGDFLFEPLVLLQNTAPISPGSSGGGLFDGRARLIGITTFRLKDSQGLNFAIAINMYTGLIERSKINSLDELTRAVQAIEQEKARK